jgi:hypothetical protein
MTAFILAGFYLEIDTETLAQNYDPAIIFSFIQLIGKHVERHRLIVLHREVYLSHYDPTILAVCLIYDHKAWLTRGVKRLIGIERCTSNYRGSSDETVDVMTLPVLIRSSAIRF